MSLVVEIKKLAHFGDLELPKYETVLAAGADLRAAVEKHAPMVLEPGARALVPTGICLLYTSPSPRDQRGSRMPSSA